jgi:hypothetical protein
MLFPMLLRRGGGWSPAKDANLAWWIAARLGGLWQTTARLALADDNDEVIGDVEDQGPNGYDVSQTTTAKKPTFQGGVVNGLPVMRFDGSDDLLVRSVANWQVADAAGMLFVVANASDNDHVVSSSDEGSTSRHILFAPRSQIIQRNADTQDTVRGGVGTGAWHIFVFASTGTAYKIFIDGVDQDPLSVAGGANNGDWLVDIPGTRDNLVVGAWKNTTEHNFMTGDIAEIFYISGYDADVVASGLGYLNGMYAIY